jgi:hypothetical protein
MAPIVTGKRQPRAGEGELYDNDPHAWYDRPEDTGLLDGPAYDPRDEG